MRSEKISKALNDIDDKYITHALNYKTKEKKKKGKNKFKWNRWHTLAACLYIAIFALCFGPELATYISSYYDIYTEDYSNELDGDSENVLYGDSEDSLAGVIAGDSEDSKSEVDEDEDTWTYDEINEYGSSEDDSIYYDDCCYDIVTDIDSLTTEQQEIMDNYGLSDEVDEDLMDTLLESESDVSYYSVTGVDDNEVIIIYIEESDVKYYAVLSE